MPSRPYAPAAAAGATAAVILSPIVDSQNVYFGKRQPFPIVGQRTVRSVHSGNRNAFARRLAVHGHRRAHRSRWRKKQNFVLETETLIFGRDLKNGQKGCVRSCYGHF